jgi:hypothetical protein
MNDRPISPLPNPSRPRGAAAPEPPLVPAAPPEDGRFRRDESDETLDKYDLSTLACTD